MHTLSIKRVTQKKQAQMEMYREKLAEYTIIGLFTPLRLIAVICIILKQYLLPLSVGNEMAISLSETWAL